MKKLLALVILSVSAAVFCLAQENNTGTLEPWSKVAPAVDNDIFEKVLEYRKKGDFGKAVDVAVAPGKDKQLDDFLLQTTADTYFQWAQADSSNRERWVTLAVQYSERALQANPSDLVNTFNVAESYMAAGMNLPSPKRCDYYQKSVRVFEQLKSDPRLQGEWGTIEGQRVQLEPFREKLTRHVENLRMMAAKCPGFH